MIAGMAAGLYMDAVITPNRSLSARGRCRVMAVTLVLAAVPISVFWAIGAPIASFFVGMGVIGLWLALHLSARAGRRERVRVSGQAVEVIRHERRVWSSPPAFTRVEVEGEADEARVWLRLSGRQTPVADSLSPGERRDFARALQDAVRAARAERAS